MCLWMCEHEHIYIWIHTIYDIREKKSKNESESKQIQAVLRTLIKLEWTPYLGFPVLCSTNQSNPEVSISL